VKCSSRHCPHSVPVSTVTHRFSSNSLFLLPEGTEATVSRTVDVLVKWFRDDTFKLRGKLDQGPLCRMNASSHFHDLPGGATSLRDVQDKLLSKRSDLLGMWNNKWRDFHLAGNDLHVARLFGDTEGFDFNVKREV
jgi:hypothetical protein